MKIIIVETDAKGGLIHYAYQLAEAFAAVGVDTTLVTGREYELADLPHQCKVAPILRLWSPVEEPARSALGAASRRVLWTARRGMRALVLAREWARLTRYIKKQQPDVVLFSIIRFPWIALYLRNMSEAGITLGQVCHEFANREASEGTGLLSRVSNLPSRYEYFSSIFLLSQSARQEFCAIYPEECGKTFVIPHGPELLFEPEVDGAAAVVQHYGIAEHERIVLMFGGLRPSKGVPELIEAYALLRDRPDTRLIIAGYPSKEFDADAEVAKVKQLGLERSVQFDFRYLPMGELGALIRRADVVVFPYRTATSSGALALAQSMGRPVVATAVGGLLDAVVDGDTGRLVAQGDSAAMAAAITELLDAPEAARAMGERGHASVTGERSWNGIAQMMLAEMVRRKDQGSPSQPSGAGTVTK